MTVASTKEEDCRDRRSYLTPYHIDQFRIVIQPRHASNENKAEMQSCYTRVK